MEVYRKPAEIQELVQKWKDKGQSVGFVPTMGSLHAGHLALIRRARRENKRVVVSIFVNPLQFGQGEDYMLYPRDFPSDKRLCEQAFVDALFQPSADRLYPEGHSAMVDPGPLAETLEGASRPGHFKGVATVVVKLFNLTQPDKAYFGEKDYQQLKVIEGVTRDLNLPVEIVPCETVREKDGLALSSRNQFLGPQQRKHAPGLHQALLRGRELAHKRGAKPGETARRLRRVVERVPGAHVDYLRIVDPVTLQDAESFRQPTRVVAAAWFGKTRLIDNISLT